MFRGLFEFFEIVADELLTSSPSFITPTSISSLGASSILDDLRDELEVTTHAAAINAAVDALRKHFEGKDSNLPFDFDANIAKFTANDTLFLQFVSEMRAIRSLGKHSRDFECTVATRLKLRATGSIHRVGHPRDTKKKRKEFNSHLKQLGFRKPVLLGMEKDGGLDIIWQLPLGTVPHRPFISVQCKNAKFDLGVADGSSGSGNRSLSQHGGLQAVVHVPCVFFNDYLYPEMLGRKQLQFVPLGLTDLAVLSKTVTLDLI